MRDSICKVIAQGESAVLSEVVDLTRRLAISVSTGNCDLSRRIVSDLQVYCCEYFAKKEVLV